MRRICDFLGERRGEVFQKDDGMAQGIPCVVAACVVFALVVTGMGASMRQRLSLPKEVPKLVEEKRHLLWLAGPLG